MISCCSWETCTTITVFCSLPAPVSFKSFWCSSPVWNEPLNLVARFCAMVMLHTALTEVSLRFLQDFWDKRTYKTCNALLSLYCSRCTIHHQGRACVWRNFSVLQALCAELLAWLRCLSNILKLKCFWAFPPKMTLSSQPLAFFLEQVQQC